jgi:hypothetical protein
MTGDLLQHIQTLQFHDKAAAENLLLKFIRDTFPLEAVSVELRPLAVSLNSFNGFMTLADDSRLFFKTHTEPDGVIGEYYNAGLMAEAGYPIIQPLYSSTEAGKQFLIYEVISDPSVFDVAWAIEQGDETLLGHLTLAQNNADDQLLLIYLNTLDNQSEAAAAKAPIHQLFYHRITEGRLERFYGPLPGKAGGDVNITLPDGVHSMAEVRQKQWIINGQHYDETLDDLIVKAASLLKPDQSDISIIGHGDAHNGNVFFRQHMQPPSLLYFDPAFAGRHHPLLDLTKPLFHNVFAMWMYFPQVKQQQTKINISNGGNTLAVNHDYKLHRAREMFLTSKIQRVLIPILKTLKEQNSLRPDWRAFLKAALFCCPFLTMNLTDSARFQPEISLLGLAMSVEMGAESREKRSLIDRVLDEVEEAL